MCKFFPDIKVVQKQDFVVGNKELLRSRHVRRVVLGCKEGEPSEESDVENYCLCHLYIRKILINCWHLEDKESKTTEIVVKSQ